MNPRPIILAIVVAALLLPTAFAQDRPLPEPAPTVLPTAPPETPESPEQPPAPDVPIAEPVVETPDTDIIDVPVAVDVPPADLEPAPSPDPAAVAVVESMVILPSEGSDDTVHWPNRREVPEGDVILAFDDVSVEETLDFIAATTGKVIIPVNLTALRTKKITLHNDSPVDRSIALDMLFTAFRLNDVGVIERPDIIIIGLLDQTLNDIGDIPVLGVDDDVMPRSDRGTLVIKVFEVERTEAAVIGDRISEMFPDYGLLTVDPISNQIVILGDIGLCQQVQQLIDQLDRVWQSGRLKTFRLRYADASEIADNIYDLFQDDGTQRATGSTQARGRQPARTQQSTSTTDLVELRLTVNVQQNSVTVEAEPEDMDRIAELIVTEWDVPRPDGTSKLYVLKYSDPVKVRNLLQEILGTGSTTATAGRQGQGNAARAGAADAISGVYRFEAYPDKNALLVLSKTEESFGFLDSIIAAVDEPSAVGLPRIVELKHASAISLAQELNALLAPAGVSATISRPDTGLSGEGFSSAEGGSTSSSTEEGGEMSFPWQQGGASSSDEQSPESSLIAKIRIVPIVRQNALAILAPPAYIEAIVDTITHFDRPSRQVMISATIAAVTLTDELNLGLRWGSGVTASGDNSIEMAGDLTGTVDDILSGIFDGGATFTLSGEGNNNLGIVLDALAKLTNVRIIQQPRAFTADNQEAIFFNGKEVPVQTSTETTTTGLVGGFEYRDVGVMLNVRPRITTHGDVDLTINVEISEVESDAGGVGDNPIFARRQVRSQILVHDGQTVLIGGLLKEREEKIKRKIPLLGDIPFLGDLFTSVDDQTIREELIVFVTPVVVEQPTVNDTNYNEDFLQRLHEITLPLDEQVERIKDAGDSEFLHQRLQDPGSDSARDEEPTSQDDN